MWHDVILGLSKRLRRALVPRPALTAATLWLRNSCDRLPHGRRVHLRQRSILEQCRQPTGYIFAGDHQGYLLAAVAVLPAKSSWMAFIGGSPGVRPEGILGVVIIRARGTER